MTAPAPASSDAAEPDRILVGFDGRAESADALRLAVDLAAGFDDPRLMVISAFGFEQEREREGTYEERRDDYFAQTHMEAAAIVAPLAFEHVTVEDWPPRCIHEVAERVGAALIVLGSTSRSKLGAVLLGSTASKLLHPAPCAVAITARGYGREVPGELAPIGIGYDSGPESEHALALAARLAGRTASELRIIAATPVAGGWPLPSDRARREAQEALEGRVREAAERCGEGTKAIIEPGWSSDVLRSQAHELGLLVLGSRNYGPLGRVLIGDTVDRLLIDSPCSLLIVPRPGSAS